jgi:hypothetical protein
MECVHPKYIRINSNCVSQSLVKGKNTLYRYFNCMISFLLHTCTWLCVPIIPIVTFDVTFKFLLPEFLKPRIPQIGGRTQPLKISLEIWVWWRVARSYEDTSGGGFFMTFKHLLHVAVIVPVCACARYVKYRTKPSISMRSATDCNMDFTA